MDFQGRCKKSQARGVPLPPNLIHFQSYLEAFGLYFLQLIFEIAYLSLDASGIMPDPDVLISTPSRGEEMR
jgi:hypothetical protein